MFDTRTVGETHSQPEAIPVVQGPSPFWQKVRKASEQALGRNPSDLGIAKHIGVARSTVGRWRKEGVIPDSDGLRALEKAFGLPANHWLGQVEMTAPARLTPTAEEEWLIKQLRRDEGLEGAVRAIVKRWRFADGS